jgi:hypothetical protein
VYFFVVEQMLRHSNVAFHKEHSKEVYGIVLSKRQYVIAYYFHFYISNAEACAAMPSLRPVKPKRSVVVALMLTQSMSTPRSAATFSRMACMCGSIFGA